MSAGMTVAWQWHGSAWQCSGMAVHGSAVHGSAVHGSGSAVAWQYHLDILLYIVSTALWQALLKPHELALCEGASQAMKVRALVRVSAQACLHTAATNCQQHTFIDTL